MGEISDLGQSQRCELCGDVYHTQPDPEDQKWMGLRCPGAEAPQEAKDAFRTALAEAYAAEVRRQAMQLLKEDPDYIDRRHAQWQARTRPDGTTKSDLPSVARVSVALLDDINMRTGAEVARQKREEVFQEPVFDIEVPHLTVPGTVPMRSDIVAGDDRKKTGSTDADYQIYLDPPPSS